MQKNSESKCLIIKGINKQKANVTKDEIKSFMTKLRLTTFFCMDMHNVPYYFITAD